MLHRYGFKLGKDEKIMKEKVREIILSILERNNNEEVTNDTPLDIDSIEFVRIVVELEEEFEIEFQDFDLNINSFQKISDYILYINNRLEEK